MMPVNATVKEKTIIAICSTTGPQSGKSTYLKTVLKRYPDAEHVRFSDPLISFLETVSTLLGLGSLDYETLKRTILLPASGCDPAVTGRDFMIAAGDALRKALRPSFYADILSHRVESLKGNLVVLDDLRKIPEVEALVNSDYKILIINVVRPGRDARDNDCEFTREGLIRDLPRASNVRYMEVEWDQRGSFRKVRDSL